MKKFAQILNKKAHWVFESDEKPEFAPNIVLVEITGKDEIREGWDYDETTEKFSNPIEPESQPEIHEPTNAEVAQMISDLQADLAIAGVI